MRSEFVEHFVCNLFLIAYWFSVCVVCSVFFDMFNSLSCVVILLKVLFLFYLTDIFLRRAVSRILQG